jgi:ATP phosphoribosyltransferase regulatory subunit
LVQLPDLYGGPEVLDRALVVLPDLAEIRDAIASLRWLASHIDNARITFDLSDLRGYAYYTGVRFSIFSAQAKDALARGGRYDEVGSVFGRNRPAVGFSLDVKMLASAVARSPLHAAIRAPWGEASELRSAIAGLRRQGETVVCVLPGHESELDEFQCDRELLQLGGHWVVKAV